MSLEQLKAFLAKAKDDQSIQEKLKAAKSPEEVVGIAKEHGHEFTADKISHLNEEELDEVELDRKRSRCTISVSFCLNF